MIHDILLSLMNPFPKRTPIEEFLLNDAASAFLHPSEKRILSDIIVLMNLHREISIFTKINGTHTLSYNNTTIVHPDGESLPKGFYLGAFANGVDKVLEVYLNEIANFERIYLENPNHSLMQLYSKLHDFKPMLLYLQQLIRGVRSQKLHGCLIVQYVNKHSLHGDEKIVKANQIIQSSLNVVFLKQLTHWLLYAKVVDTYGEFFIQCSENRNVQNATVESEKGTSMSSGKNTVVSNSETSNSYAEIWRYEIYYELLPHYLSSNWAEKVLFIGQTVLMFKTDANNLNRKTHIWYSSDHNPNYQEASLWNNNENEFLKKIQTLQILNECSCTNYDETIDEIKSYVSNRLYEIAVNQADLMKQLKLIKDFYLLGRGELFLEFIKRTFSIRKNHITENTIRDLVKAFEASGHSVGISEDLEKFTLTIPKYRIDNDTEIEDLGYIQYIALQYKINWPLHMLFAPKVMERYNQVFRFLLLIKKTQYELHMIWCNQTREMKMLKKVDINVMQLRNQLMFFIDNLQYYIQVDVLESQFSILKATVLECRDFERIQKAHSIFQANILSLCFLLCEEEPNNKSTISQSINSVETVNPVYTILNDIFHYIEEFCEQFQSDDEAKPNSTDVDIKYLQDHFTILIDSLINTLSGLKVIQGSSSLSQLLLRLDFNQWFSLESQRKSECLKD